MVGSTDFVIDLSSIALLSIAFSVFLFIVSVIVRKVEEGNEEEQRSKRYTKGDTMEEKTYVCKTCNEEYDNKEEAMNCCPEEEAEILDVTLTLIDGELKEGYFECQDKECGWTGTEEDTSSNTLANMKKLVMPNGEILYTGSVMEDRTDEDENGGKADLIVRTCPDCDSHRIRFVEAKKEKKNDNL